MSEALPFFFRKTIRETIEAVSLIIKTEIPTRGFYEYTYKNIQCFIYRTLDVVCIIFTTTTHGLDMATIRAILNAMNSSNITTIDQLMSIVSDANKIKLIRQELDETMKITQDVFDKLLLREDQLDDLLAKSERLSYEGKKLLDGAKKMNRCCVIS
jgi:synaptobrevin family protein YKT6